jgi:GTP-binding protein Era
MSKKTTQTKCGYVAIIGKPNVGKSTFLNRSLNKKLVITSRKPQTTRHRILGIKTKNNAQILYLDTPGLHAKEKNILNQYMNRAARSVLHDVNVIVWMITQTQWNKDDAFVLKHLAKVKTPVILAINKIDQLKKKADLLPFIDALKTKFNFADIVPISAKNNLQLDYLEQSIIQHLPHQPFYYATDQITDCNDAFVAAEMIREKLIRQLGQELPYDTLVTIDALERTSKIINISTTIFVNKANQKPIILGKDGQRLKRIATDARLDLERFFEKKVFLKVWVKIKTNWANNAAFLNYFGQTP